MKKSLLIFTILFGAFIFSFAPNVYALNSVQLPLDIEDLPTSSHQKHTYYVEYLSNSNFTGYFLYDIHTEFDDFEVLTSCNDSGYCTRTFNTKTPGTDVYIDVYKLVDNKWEHSSGPIRYETGTAYGTQYKNEPNNQIQLVWSKFPWVMEGGSITKGPYYFICMDGTQNSCEFHTTDYPGMGDDSNEEEEDTSWLGDIGEWFQNLWDAIISIPSKILGFLNDIFVPDIDSIKFQFNSMIFQLETRFGLVSTGLEDLNNNISEKPVENITSNYNIPGVGTLNLKFLDVSYLTKGVEFFRPIIRGFITLMLVFYNYKMVLTFIGQDPGMYARAKEESDKK